MTTAEAKKRYGLPSQANESKYMVLWQVPADIQEAFKHVRFSALGTTGFPKKIYCNKDALHPLWAALQNIIAKGLTKELKTWDGAYVIRPQRGSLTSISMHSWGLAFDVNAAENVFGKKPKMSEAFVLCWLNAGFNWGGSFKAPRTDGMHFELK